MDNTELITITQEAIWLTIKLSSPIMLIGLVVGLIISLFQALTQIQEMTLSFVPKMIAIFFAIFVLLPAMMVNLVSFTQTIADHIVNAG